MPRPYFILVAVALVGLTARSALAQQPMQWETDLKAAQQKAAASNRLILIHFWAPWCPPCMRMEQEVFNQPGLNQALDAAFIPLKLNYDDHGDVAKQYGVTHLPTDVVITAQGELLKKLNNPKNPLTAAQYANRLNKVATASRAAPPAIAAAGSPTQPAAIAGSRTQPGTTVAASPAKAAPATAASGPSGGRYAEYFNQQAIEPSAVGPRYASQATTAWDQGAKPGSTAGRPSTQATGPAASSNWAGSAGVAKQPEVPPSNFYDRRPATVAASGVPVVNPNLQSATATAGSPFTQASSGTSSLAAPRGQAPLQPAVARPQASEAPMGLDGYCPVHLAEKQQWVPGNRQWGVIHRGRTYLFASPACKERFLTEPDRFSPVMAGNDPVVAVDQGQVAPGRREHGVYFSGQIVLFSSETSLERFYQNPDRYAAAMTMQR